MTKNIPPIKEHPINGKTTLLQYWQATKIHKREYRLSLMLPLSAVLLSVIIPLFASKILASLITTRQHIWLNFWLLTLAAIVGLITNNIGIRNCMTLQAKVMHDLHIKVFERLMRRSVGFYNNQIGGKLVSDANDYAHSYGQIFNAGFISAGNFLLSTVIGLLIIFVSSFVLGLIITVLLIFLIIWTKRETATRSNLRLKRLTYTKKVVSHLSDSLVNAVTVKTFAREEVESQTSRQLSDQLEDVRIRDWTRTVTNESNRMGVLLVAQIALVLGLILLTRHNPDILAAGIFAFTYTIGLLSRFFTVNNMIRQVDDSLLLALPMTVLMEQPDEIQDAPNAQVLKVTKGAIQCNDVGFHYSDAAADAAVFSKLNLDIKPGEKVGLVGHSGGGKTTLTRLLLRFDDINSGSITVDGQDISEVTQTSLREQIGYVPQEPLLFHRSILENIAYGKPTAKLADVQAAAEKAYAADFIAGLSNGYDTIVGERGVKLSGGQRQRVAIARAIFKNAPILVLDEATSALDSESEKAIQAALWELMKDKTAIVIAHRLSTIQTMDRIIVMELGKVVEEGSHQELIKQKGLYAKLWQHQSGGFIKD